MCGLDQVDKRWGQMWGLEPYSVYTIWLLLAIWLGGWTSIYRVIPGDRDGEKHFLWSNWLISTPNPYETGSIVCNFADEKVKREKLGILEAAVGYQDLRTTTFPQRWLWGSVYSVVSERKPETTLYFSRGNTCRVRKLNSVCRLTGNVDTWWLTTHMFILKWQMQGWRWL